MVDQLMSEQKRPQITKGTCQANGINESTIQRIFEYTNKRIHESTNHLFI